jgi:sugar-specific transcriptional regulator TrmB
MVAGEDIEIALVKLGLTILQAEVYLTLTKIRNASIRTIASTTKLDRANLYRTVAQLQKIGLVQVSIGIPNTYNALNVQDAIQALLFKRTNELEDVRRYSMESIKKIQCDPSIYCAKQDVFQIVPGGGKEVIVSAAIYKTENCVDFILELSDIVKSINVGLDDFYKLLERNVKKRCIIYDDLKSVRKKSKVLVSLKKFNNFSSRFTYKVPETALVILDKKEVFVHTRPLLPDWWGGPWFRTNNICLIGIVQKYFDYLWSESEEQVT